MKKFHVFLNLNDEENWINTIQEAGYRLDWVNPFLHCYTFQLLTADDQFNPYTRLDFRDKGMSRRNYQDYRQFFSDSGWRLVAGSRHGGIQYLQQKTMTSDRDIFSDERSRIRIQRRFGRFSLFYATFFLSYVFAYWKMTGSINFLDIRNWYLTPGLWQMQGEWFWKAIIFETPFAVMRVVPLFIFLVVGIYYLCRAIRNGYQQ